MLRVSPIVKKSRPRTELSKSTHEMPNFTLQNNENSGMRNRLRRAIIQDTIENSQSNMLAYQ
jgi:hypothetical protein